MRYLTLIASLVSGIVAIRTFVLAARMRRRVDDPHAARSWTGASVALALFALLCLATAGVLLADLTAALLPMFAGIVLMGAVFLHFTMTAASARPPAEETAAQADDRPGDQTAEKTASAPPSGDAATADETAATSEKRAPERAPSLPKDTPTRPPRPGSSTGIPVPTATPEPIGGSVLFSAPHQLAAIEHEQRTGSSHVGRRIRKYSGTFRFAKKERHPTEPGKQEATILVVEDSHINRTILDKYLDRLGHRSILVSDGRSALSILSTNKSIELVLLDYWLPDMEGLEILEAMKSGGEHGDTPVLMLSSEEDSETIAQCIEAGADDFLPKPFSPRLLQARIDACLSKRRFRMRERQFMARLEQERKRSEELLRVILPTPIAQELSNTNRVKPRRYEQVAVLFADISGFTAYCDKHRPEEVLSHLQSIVIAFEGLAEQHGVQKIKTIGDSFMAASGLLHEVDDPVLRCVELGMDMIKVVEGGVEEWNLRIGVDYGPVVAGIVGRSQFLFDIWGDTVNTASRIEANGIDNGICVSKRAWEQISHQVEGGSIGMVHAKGKGDIELFQVEGLRAIPAGHDIEESSQQHGYTVH